MIIYATITLDLRYFRQIRRCFSQIDAAAIAITLPPLLIR